MILNLLIATTNKLLLIVPKFAEKKWKHTYAQLAVEACQQINDYVSKTPICGLYFNGKRDVTNAPIESNEKLIWIKTKEEHITVLLQPRNVYFNHIGPEDGTAKSISDEIIGIIQNCDDLSHNIRAVGLDGTAANTGNKNGKNYIKYCVMTYRETFWM